MAKKKPTNSRIAFFLRGDKLLLALRGVAAVIALVLLAQTLHKAYRPGGYDFTDQLKYARALWEGNNPYAVPATFPLLYPLFVCVALLPIAFLPYGLANTIWFGVNAAALWFLSKTIVKFYAPSVKDGEFLRLFTLCGLLLLGVIQNNFANGQFNFPVLALSVLFFKFLREGKSHFAGAFLAAAIALKLTPLIFLVYLFFRRGWAAMAWCAFYVPVFLVGLPLLAAGPDILGYYQGYLGGYLEHSLKYHGNPPLNEAYYLSPYLRFFLPFLEGVWLNLLSAFLVTAPLVWLQWKRGEPSRNETLLFSLYALSTLWILPFSETHHLAFLFPAVFLLTHHYFWEKGRMKSLGFWGLSLAYLCVWLGKLSFTALFFSIGLCYVLTARLLWTRSRLP